MWSGQGDSPETGTTREPVGPHEKDPSPPRDARVLWRSSRRNSRGMAGIGNVKEKKCRAQCRWVVDYEPLNKDASNGRKDDSPLGDSRNGAAGADVGVPAGCRDRGGSES